MNSKQTSLLLVAVLGLGLAPRAFPQATPPEQKVAPPIFSYDPGGRRDPFKDLFGGKELQETRIISGLSDLSIDEISLMGIVQSKDAIEAIAAFSDGFPMTLREGDKLSDGYVLSIRADAVVFRKTREQGRPLSRPKDIVKEISPEERPHE